MADRKRCPVTGKSDNWPYVWRCKETGTREISLAAAQTLGINDWHKYSHHIGVAICEEHFTFALEAGCINSEGDLPI